jgi:hypothetical protein
MSTLSKVVLGFVFLAALGLFYMSMRTLRTHQAWKSAAVAHENELAVVKKKTEDLVEGTDDPAQPVPSIAELQAALNEALAGRGRVWRDVTRGLVDPNSGITKVNVALPNPHQIADQMILYAFAGTDEASTRYMGEFKVAFLAGQEVTLEPTLKATPTDIQRITTTQGPWTLYEVMPADSHDVFAGKTDQELIAILPRPPQRRQNESDDEFNDRVRRHEALIQEYVKDGKPPEPNDPPDRVRVVVKITKNYEELDQQSRNTLDQLKIPKEAVQVDQELKFDQPTAEQLFGLEIAQEVRRYYQRPLRDYAFFFREANRQWPILEDRLAAAAKDLEYIRVALTDAQTHETFTKDLRTRLQAELARVQSERDAVVGYQRELEAKVARAEQMIADLYAENKQLAARLAEGQFQALQRAERAATTARTAAAK